MANTELLQQRIQMLAAQLAEEFCDLDDENALSLLDAIEERAVGIGDALSRELTRQQFGEKAPTDVPAVCPACEKPGRPKDPRERELLGRRGPVTLSEPEYYCTCCRKSFFPSDLRDRCGS
jgi:hypothetical protein